MDRYFIELLFLNGNLKRFELNGFTRSQSFVSVQLDIEWVTELGNELKNIGVQCYIDLYRINDVQVDSVYTIRID